MTNAPLVVTPHTLQEMASKCAVLIIAAGFEPRARRVLEALQSARPTQVLLIRYVNGEAANEANFDWMHSELLTRRGIEGFGVIEFDSRVPDEFYERLSKQLLRWRPDSVGEAWLDVSALPMQGVCIGLAAVRSALPDLAVRVLYTEAAQYFPTKAETRSRNSEKVPALSGQMSSNLIPKLFGGSSSAAATCLVLFAGYEVHRSFGVVDELNPSRLVVAYGTPPRAENAWRLEWSKRLHLPLHSTRPTATEVVSTLQASDSFAMLSRYYNCLFADHDIAISPICSKMQCISSFLMWERFRDIQLVFPLPVSYATTRYSVGARAIYEFKLPRTSGAW